MKTPAIPLDEERRLQKLAEYDVLDTDAEPAFDAIARLAAHVAETPIALVSLVDRNRQWFKARIGLDARETPRDISFCGHVVADGHALEVVDALTDPRFCDNPLVVGEPHVRFYMGVPLRTADGFVLGTLCTIDREPRTLSEKQKAMLALLADQLVDQLEFRRRNADLRRRELTQAALLRALPGLYAHLASDGTILELHGAGREALHLDPRAFVGRRLVDALPPAAASSIADALAGARRGARTHVRFDLRTDERVEHFEARISQNPDETFVVFVDQITSSIESRDLLAEQKALLEAVVRAQSSFLADATPRDTFTGLLVDLLALADSEYGFIGEVLRDEHGAPFLQTHAITNIAWNEESHALYQKHAEQGLRFTNLNTLFGAALVREDVVIANDPGSDPRRSGLPPGHAELRSFLGLPLFSGERMIGLVGLANRPGGYDERLVSFLRPLSTAIARLIELVRATRERASAELALRDKEAQYRRIVELSHEGIWVIDDSGCTTFANERMADMLGVSVEAMHGRTIFEFMDEAAAREAISALERRRSGITEQHDFRFRRADGSDLWAALETTPILDEHGQYQGALAMVMDIGERRRSEQAIRERELQFRSILESARDAIVTFDEQGRIEHVNGAVERDFGYSAAELLGRHVRQLLPALERDAFLRDPRPVNGEDDPVGREVSATRRDGTAFPVELAVGSFRIDGRRYFTGIMRDIRDRKRIERLQSEFVSTVSHELRTPLTSIRGSLALVSAGVTGSLYPEAKEYVDIALSNTERLVRLINDILDIEKMQSGNVDFRLRSTELAPALRALVAANEPFAVAHRVTLLLPDEIPPGEVLVDPDRFAQVLTNLLSNAVKFSPPESTVDVGAERRGRTFRIHVRDRGPGVPAEFEGRVFQRFAQADASNTRHRGGTGLGLAIAKELVERMRGTIGFEPAEGGGTTFFVELPYLAPVMGSDEMDGERPRVLVCEDDPDAAQVLEATLASAGFFADRAPTLERARRLLAGRRYDAITLDLMLADGSGTDLMWELRSSETTRTTPLVVVTGSDAPLGGAALMVTDILAKPFDEQRMLEAVRAAASASQNPVPRILHVEDDRDLRRLVRSALPASWTMVGADSVSAARSALAKTAFDVVLLDLTLPDGDGHELLDAVGRAQVIIFSAWDAPDELVERVSGAFVKSRTRPSDVHDAVVSLVRNACARGLHP